MSIAKQDRLNLRLAKSIEDLKKLHPISVEFHSESRFRDIKYSAGKRDALWQKTLSKPDFFGMIMVELGDEVVGYSFVSAGEYIVGTDALLTTVFAFYVRSHFRGTLVGGKAAIRLVTAIKRWSEARNAQEILVHATSGIDIERTDRFFRRARFNVIGGNYALRLIDSSK